MRRKRRRSEDVADCRLMSREEFARISAVEGLHLTDEMRMLFEDFDRRKLPDAERRREIIARFRRDAAE